MEKAQEKKSMARKLRELDGLLKSFREDHDFDYYCALFSQPEDWERLSDFELSYHPFQAGEQGQAVDNFVHEEWLDRRFGTMDESSNKWKEKKLAEFNNV